MTSHEGRLCSVDTNSSIELSSKDFRIRLRTAIKRWLASVTVFSLPFIEQHSFPGYESSSD